MIFFCWIVSFFWVYLFVLCAPQPPPNASHSLLYTTPSLRTIILRYFKVRLTISRSNFNCRGYWGLKEGEHNCYFLFIFGRLLIRTREQNVSSSYPIAQGRKLFQRVDTRACCHFFALSYKMRRCNCTLEVNKVEGFIGCASQKWYKKGIPCQIWNKKNRFSLDFFLFFWF